MSNGNHRWVIVAGAVLIAAVAVSCSPGETALKESPAARQAPPGSVASGEQPSKVAEGEPARQPAEVAGAQATPQPAVATSESSSSRLTLPSTPTIQWETLKFSLEGFQPGETVVLSVEDQGTLQEIGRVEVDGEGRLQDAEIVLPSWLESGRRTVEAVGTSGQTRASGTLYVRAKELWINLNDYALRQASRMGFIAGGFEPGDHIQVYLTQGGDLSSRQPLVTVTADDVGNTAWTEVEIPVMPTGHYDLLLKGENTPEELRASVSVSAVEPDLELSPWSGLPGRTVELNAKGFLPGEQVEVFVGQSAQPAMTLEADEFGNLWGAGPVPIPVDSRGSTLPITLRGKTSTGAVTREFTIVGTHPWMEMSSYADFPGARVMVHGGGFGAGERVTLHMGRASDPVVAEVVADEDGSYRGLGPGLVPSDAEGQVTFVVVGESSGAQAEATFKVLQPFIPVTPPTR